MGAGVLYLVATPIGNLADITLRGLETLRSVHCIAAEDTRHTRKLLSYYDIHKPLVSYHSHNARERGPELIRRIEGGEDIALATDAGTPGISDPGALLVRDALFANVTVTAIPGPSAPIAALVVSGLPTQPFAFLGFPPARGPGRKRFFASYASLEMTLVLFESSHRLMRTLRDILEHWGDRQVVLARELTKQHEEIFRGTVSLVQEHFSGGVRGEVTLVVAGCEAVDPSKHTGAGEGGETPAWLSHLSVLLQQGVTVRDATETVARHYGLSRRTVYEEALAIRRQTPPDAEGD